MSATTATGVSLVITVRDEGATVDTLCASIAAQTRPPDEVVIVDGGSRDDTVARLHSWQDRLPLRVLSRPGANISAGRNAGIVAATHDRIAVTDAGVRLDPRWLAALVAPLGGSEQLPVVMHTSDVEVVAGFFLPDPRTTFEVAMGATVLPVLADITPDRFLPSSRSIAFQRAAWARAGGYPEWLDHCEDLVFDLRLRRAGARMTFAPGALAYFRPRGSWRAYWWQYFCYARGDGKAGLFARRHAARYGAYTLLGWVVLGGWRRPWLWPVLVAGAAVYLRRPYARLHPWLPRLTPGARGAAIAAVPLIRLVGDIAKLAGYPVGLVWRWRQHGLGRDWRQIDG